MEEPKDPNYQRENAMATCANCNGPIFQGEMVISYLDTFGTMRHVHRFTPSCTHFKEQEKRFAESLGITL